MLIAFVAMTITFANAADVEAYDAEPEYGEQGSHEVGGSFVLHLNEDVKNVQIGPSIGWFVSDMFEISTMAHLRWVRPAGHDAMLGGNVLVEPSFHVPLSSEGGPHAFGGVGVGVGHNGEVADFEVVPRVGMNIEVGRSGVVTPAARLPILFRKDVDFDRFGPSVGFDFEVGVGTLF